MQLNFNKLLQEIHRNDIKVSEVREYHEKNPEVALQDLLYKKTGDTIVHVCCRLGHTDILNFLHQNWSKDIAFFRNYDGKTGLHEAAQFSQHEVVQMLIKFGAEVDFLKRADWTSLMLACTKTGENAYKTVDLLLRNGARTGLVNKDGWTALHLAARYGDEKIIKLLIKHSENVINTKTNNGRTVLHIATLHNHIKSVEIFLKYINVKTVDNCGYVPLHDAVFTENQPLIDLLLARGADLSATNNVGLTCLHLAASEGKISLIKYFVALGLNVNSKSDVGLTPLHCAARKKQKEAMELLIELGAEENLTDVHGRTASDYYNY